MQKSRYSVNKIVEPSLKWRLLKVINKYSVIPYSEILVTVVLGEHDRNVPSGDEVRIVASEIIVVSFCSST